MLVHKTTTKHHSSFAQHNQTLKTLLAIILYTNMAAVTQFSPTKIIINLLYAKMKCCTCSPKVFSSQCCIWINLRNFKFNNFSFLCTLEIWCSDTSNHLMNSRPNNLYLIPMLILTFSLLAFKGYCKESSWITRNRRAILEQEYISFAPWTIGAFSREKRQDWNWSRLTDFWRLQTSTQKTRKKQRNQDRFQYLMREILIVKLPQPLKDYSLMRIRYWWKIFTQ